MSKLWDAVVSVCLLAFGPLKTVADGQDEKTIMKTSITTTTILAQITSANIHMEYYYIIKSIGMKFQPADQAVWH